MPDLIKRIESEPGHFIQPRECVATQTSESGHQIRRYGRILLTHRWLLLATILSSLGLGALYSFTRVSYYKSTAVIEFVREPTISFLFNVVQPEMTQRLDWRYLKTRYKMLRSRDLSLRVVRRLQLDHDPDFSNVTHSAGLRATLWALGSRLIGWFKGKDPELTGQTGKPKSVSRGGLEGALSEHSQGESSLADRLRSNLRVTPVDRTRLVNISYTSRSARLTAEIVNTLADEAIQMNFETHIEATRRATEFLKSQMLEMQVQVEESQEKLLNYARAFNLLDVEEGENIVLHKLEVLSSALSGVDTQLISESPRFERIKTASVENLPQPFEDDKIRKLKERKSELRQELSSLRGRFGPRWQPVIQLKEQLKEVEAQLRSAKEQAIEQARIEHEDLLTRLENLSRALDEQQRIAEELKQDSIQYNILKDEVETNKRIYETLLQRVKEVGVTAGLKSSDVHIVDHGVVPGAPFSPDHKWNLLVALALGSFLGIGLTACLESLDNTVTTPEEIEAMGLPSLGFIPATAGIMTTRAREGLVGTGAGHPTNPVESHPYVQLYPRMWEAFRSLRTSLFLSGSRPAPRRILVTSAFAGEGKTTTVAHTGIVLSQTRVRTLILDMDLRRPSLGPMFKCDRKCLGLSGFLNGRCTLSSTIFPTHFDHLFILPAGRPPHNPAELLGSQRMEEMLRKLSNVFEYIIIDSPPLLDVTDAVILSARVDGVVLVAKGSRTTKLAVRKSSKHLSDVGARILGVLINNVSLRKSGHYYHYRQYYNYYNDCSTAT